MSTTQPQLIVIGIAGKAGSGKTTSAIKLRNALPQTAIRLSFANPIKDILVALGFEGHPPETSAQIIDTLFRGDSTAKETTSFFGALSCRRAMQVLGDSIKSTLGEDVFTAAMERCIWKVTHNTPAIKVIIIDDVRFQNEIETILKYTSIIVFLESDDVSDTYSSTPAHNSERQHLICDTDRCITVHNPKDYTSDYLTPIINFIGDALKSTDTSI